MACQEREGEVILSPSNILEELNTVIKERKKKFREGSYTCLLFQRGRPYIEEKLREELTELIEARNRPEIVAEAADLMYHLLVYLEAREVDWKEVEEELARRRK